MKKTVSLFGILVILVTIGIFLIYGDGRTAQLKLNEDSTPVIFLKVNGSEEVLKPWFNKRDGLYYFFLPSCVSDNKVYCDYLKDEIIIDDEKLTRYDVFFWEQDEVYNLHCAGQEYEVVFMKSSNVPALFVETETGTMEYLNVDKELIETGAITIVNETKNIEYQGELKKISARGNSTFDGKDKKAYSFTLNNSYPLCGLDAGKKWNLLAMYFEYDKIHSKLLYDMAKFLEVEYSIDSTWVDLYCNGEYNGLYLLTEAITVGEGRVDIFDLEKASADNTNISGGYLIEKDIEQRLEEEVGFITAQCNYPFMIKNPDPATEEQIQYISSYIQNVENLLVAGDKGYKDYIDLDSFAKQFLIDKIALEPDAMNMSTFFYKEADSDILKAGPLWDYDRAFGGAVPEFDLGVGDYPNSMEDWYMELYEDEEYKEKLIGYYRELLPFLKEMLESGIDEYANFVEDSVKMDSVVWPNEYYQTDMMSYLEYESHITYLKFFLANRLNYLNERWEIEEWNFEIPESSGEEHEVRFVMDDGTLAETRTVTDGDRIDNLPGLESEKYAGWGINNGGKIYNSYIPIYEDVTMNARRMFENIDEKMAYKVERLNAASDIEEYTNVLASKDFSVCIFVDGDSGLLEDAEVIIADIEQALQNI